MHGPVLLVLAQAASPSAARPDDVRVVGRRAEKALAACLARACPPKEEIEASLRVSVDQFADGRYGDARATLQRAIARNRDQAAALPGPVSSLYATLATVAEHQGDAGLWRASARTNVAVLQRYLGAADKATLTQQLAFADSLIRLGPMEKVDGLYRAVQDTAAGTGQQGLAARAAFRRAWLALMLQHDADAVRLADDAVALAAPDDRAIGQWRDILRARVAMRRGDAQALDTLAATLRQSTRRAPELLYAPSIPDVNRSRSIIETDRRNDSALRFTVRATAGVPTGTRIAQRIGRLTVHVVDLTETEAMRAAREERERAPAGTHEG